MTTTEKILELLKVSSDYISGERISRELGITRAAVWKHINKLRGDGYTIESVTNRGYKLTESAALITPEKIRSGLSTAFIGSKIHYYKETPSTNDAAKEQSTEPDGTVFIADVQTRGKGRLGREWVSPAGVGIWLSILLKPDIPPASVSAVTLAAGLAVASALGANASIKWPNDVLLKSKKVCGILTEMSAEADRVNYLVTGIGVNVNNPAFPDELSDKATSLFTEYGHVFDRCAIIRSVLEKFEKYYTAFLADGISALIPEYKSRCVTLGREVVILRGGKQTQARAVDIDEFGSLVVEADGKRFPVFAGEVSVRGLLGYS